MTDGVMIETLNGVGTTDDGTHLILQGVRGDTKENFVWALKMEMVPGLIELASRELVLQAEAGRASLPAMEAKETSVELVGTDPDEAILTVTFSGMGKLSFFLSAEKIAALQFQLASLSPESGGASRH